MTKIEKKLIAFINRYMVHIGILFVGICALGVRYMARKYVGNDVTFQIYEVPGNYHSYIYRQVVLLLTNTTEHSLFILKMLAYVGDVGIFFITCIILGKKWIFEDLLRVFYLITAIMLSPVLLQSSAVGMRLDSICICMILIAYLAYCKKWYPLVVICVAFSALISPIYWFVVIGTIVLFLYNICKKTIVVNLIYQVSMYVLIAFLLVSIITESVFFCGFRESGALEGIGSVLYLVGPSIATFVMIISFRKPKMRIMALLLQTFFLMVIGYYQTYNTMIWLYE